MSLPRQRAQTSAYRFVDGQARYIPVAGTFAYFEPWYSDLSSPFCTTLLGERFVPIRAMDGRPFRWSTDLDGIKFWARDSQWQAGADALVYFSEHLPYEDRNYIAHSHGGQCVLLAAASGFKIRSLTTIGTPVRHDVPSGKAITFIGFWQHIYDSEFDKMGWFGSWLDGAWSDDRTFKHLGRLITRYPLKDIRHSKILKEQPEIAMWTRMPWLENIRRAETQEAA